jgi:hypothetical protein
LTLSALCALSLSGSPAHGQGKKPALVRQGMVQDWSHRHVVYPRGGSLRTLLILQHDPRAMQSWQAASRANWRRVIKGRSPKKSGIHRDWSISLGLGGTAPAMYPAKYSFDASAPPDCTNDFIVFPVNHAGSGTQPNLVGFNNLYSGTLPGPDGICNRTFAGNDDGRSATTMWSYNINGGPVATSPALSLDGTKIAFVDTEGGVAHFHVLAWKSGDGKDATNFQNVLKPKTISSFTDPLAPAAGSGTASDLTLGSTTDTLSSPFVDYFNDLAYVGNDSGTLYRVKDVFCTVTVTTGTITVNPDCTGGTPPAPNLDTTWGTGGALVTGCGGVLSGPVLDSVTGNIFVGCSDGTLYGFHANGTALTALAVGDGSATGGIVDPPVLDVTNGFVYVVSGNDGTHAVLVQAKTADLSAKIVATLGPGGLFNLHAPSFNDLYFSSGYSAPGGVSNWLIYEFAAVTNTGECPTTTNGSCTALYGVGFDSLYNLNTVASPTTSPLIYNTPAFELSPSTEFVSGGVDRLFSSQIHIVDDSLSSFDITGAFPGGFAAQLGVGRPVGDGGTSGIVVDNASGLPQAASIYYSILSQNLVEKVTQSALQ